MSNVAKNCSLNWSFLWFTLKCHVWFLTFDCDLLRSQVWMWDTDEVGFPNDRGVFITQSAYMMEGFLSSGLFRNVSNIYDGAYIPVCILVYLSFFINVCQIHLLDHYVYFSKTYSFCLFFHCWNIFRVTFGDTGEFVICGKQHRSNTFILTNLPFWPCQI